MNRDDGACESIAAPLEEFGGDLAASTLCADTIHKVVRFAWLMVPRRGWQHVKTQPRPTWQMFLSIPKHSGVGRETRSTIRTSGPTVRSYLRVPHTPLGGKGIALRPFCRELPVVSFHAVDHFRAPFVTTIETLPILRFFGDNTAAQHSPATVQLLAQGWLRDVHEAVHDAGSRMSAALRTAGSISRRNGAPPGSSKSDICPALTTETNPSLGRVHATL